jgi:signal transduction histidine kinase
VLHRDHTIRQRVTVVSMLVTGLVAVLVYAALISLIRAQSTVRLTNQLSHTAREISADIRSGHWTNPLVTADRDLVQVQDDRGEVTAASPAMSGAPPLHARRPPADQRLDQRVCEPYGNQCYVVVSMRVTGASPPVTVHSLAPEPGLFPRPGLAVMLALGIPISIGLIGVGRWWTAGRRLRPVEELRAELDAINASDLQPRVSLPARRDEYYWLAVAVNATLDRLEESIRQQRRLVSDVSHDLRSPLAGLRTELEVALIDPAGADMRTTLMRVLKSTDRLQDIVTELLVLARRDAGMPRRDEPVDLADLAEKEVARMPRRITAQLDAEKDVVARVSSVDIGRVLTNLLDNAARHAESRVVVTVRRCSGKAVVEVFNDGEPIAPEDRERIFERFTRLAASRRRDSGGAGLGLAISREIAAAHGGTLTAEDCDRGARFVLRLPLTKR